jgi:N-acetylmuramoyl-L-alanine amidase
MRNNDVSAHELIPLMMIHHCLEKAKQWYYVAIMMDLPPQLPIIEQLLPYEQLLESRSANQIDLVVIHCTELPDLAMARQYGEISHYPNGTGNSGHFYIDRDGTVYMYVKPDRIANHTRGYNPRSIGIEIVNTGRYPEWFDSKNQSMNDAYSHEQVNAVIRLLNQLKAQHPQLTLISGHEDLDTAQVPASDNPDALVFRKRDPGPQFPWPLVLKETKLTYLKP